jgi:RimJ/RimL family protein N-acetyltransferase
MARPSGSGNRSDMRRAPETIQIDAGSRLERWRTSDAAATLELSLASYPELHDWMPWAANPPTRADQQAFLDASDEQWQKGDGADYGLIVDEQGAIGTWGVSRIATTTEFSIGYWLTHSAWGAGHATRATKALAGMAFHGLGATQVLIEADRANLRSEAVARRAGFRLVEVRHAEPATPAESGVYSRWALEPVPDRPLKLDG